MKYQLINERNKDYTVQEQVFYNRGFDVEDLEHYIHTTKEDDLTCGCHLDNAKLGTFVLHETLEANKRIQILVDSDTDGFTSSAIMYNYIKRIKPNANVGYIIHKKNKSHGITQDEIEELDCRLLIIPDAGSFQYEEHGQIADKGIQTIILD